MLSIDLRVLANKLEKNSDELIIKASQKGPEMFEKISCAIAAASSLLEEVADDIDNNADNFKMTDKQLDDLAALASEFDKSENEFLRKQASVLDEILLSIGAQKGIVENIKQANEDEINRLRMEKRKARREECYEDPKRAHDEMNNAKAQAKAVEQQVKKYVPLEASLQTRYSPDRPGGQMTRITDHVYQDITTGIIYDFKNGYKLQNGNEVPGGAVENQTRSFSDNRNQPAAMFETRESLNNRYASSVNGSLTKKGSLERKLIALQNVAQIAPNMLNQALDLAMDDGLSTSQIGEALGDVGSVADEGVARNVESEDFEDVIRLLESLREANWISMIADTLENLYEADTVTKDEYEHLYHIYVDPNVDFSLRNFGDLDAPDTLESSPSLTTEEQIADTIIPERRIALVLNIIQENAPHLLKQAVKKAKEAGVKREIVENILSSNIKFTGFDSLTSANQIRISESLILPQLKSLGWHDLIQMHINAIDDSGLTDKIALQKIKNKFLVKNSSESALKRLLKKAQKFDWSAFDDDEAEPDLNEPTYEIESGGFEEPTAPDFSGFGEISEEAISKPVFVSQKEPAIDIDTYSFEDEEEGPKTERKPTIPFAEEKEEIGEITPVSDLIKWKFIFEEVKKEFEKEKGGYVEGLYHKGRVEEAKTVLESFINERMNSKNAAGAFELDENGKRWIDTISEYQKGTTESVKKQPLKRLLNWDRYKVNNDIFDPQGKLNELVDKIEQALIDAKEEVERLVSRFKINKGKEDAAEQLKRNFLNNYRKSIVNRMLTKESFPEMFDSVDPVNKMQLAQNLGKISTIKGEGKRAPQGPNVPNYGDLKSAWEVGIDEYYTAFNESKKTAKEKLVEELGGADKVDLRDPELKKHFKELIDSDMKEKGLIPPYGKIFNSQSTSSILYGVGKDAKAADFGDMKTLFNDTAAYISVFWEIYKLVKPSKEIPLTDEIKAAINKKMMDQGFYPPYKPAIGNKTFAKMIFDDRSAKSYGWRMAQRGGNKEEGAPESQGDTQREVENTQGKTEAEKRMREERLRKLKDIGEPPGITPEQDLAGWTSAFRVARDIFKAINPKVFQQMEADKKAGKLKESKAKDQYVKYMNGYFIRETKYVPPFSSKGNPSGKMWFTEARNAGGNLS